MDTRVKHWEAWYGTKVVEAGVKRNGSPRRTLVTLVLIAHTKTDAKNLAKAHPELKFIERDGRDAPLASDRTSMRRSKTKSDPP
jgi:hypothetical protein